MNLNVLKRSRPDTSVLRRKMSRAGFSLVEVTMALSIMGFASISLIGLLPMGLHTLKQAMGNTIESQIVQDLTNDLLLANSSELSNYKNQTYYFDNEGVQLTATKGVPAGTIYTATIDYSAVDNTNSPAAFTSATSAYNVTLTIVNVSSPLQVDKYPVIISSN